MHVVLFLKMVNNGITDALRIYQTDIVIHYIAVDTTTYEGVCYRGDDE